MSPNQEVQTEHSKSRVVGWLVLGTFIIMCGCTEALLLVSAAENGNYVTPIALGTLGIILGVRGVGNVMGSHFDQDNKPD